MPVSFKLKYFLSIKYYLKSINYLQYLLTKLFYTETKVIKKHVFRNVFRKPVKGKLSVSGIFRISYFNNMKQSDLHI